MNEPNHWPTMRRLAVLSFFPVMGFVTAMGLVAIAWALLPPSSVSSQGVDVRITELDCDSNPELVTVTNFGSQDVEMTGWNMQSDPTTAESIALGSLGSLSPQETLQVEAGPSAEGAFVWQKEYVFRDSDNSDFVQLASDAGDVLVKVNCGATQQPTGTAAATPAPGTSTPRPAATAAPTALAAGNIPAGGGVPAPRAGLSPAILMSVGALLVAGGLSTLALPIAAAVRRKDERAEGSEQRQPHVAPAEQKAAPDLPAAVRRVPVSVDPLRPYLFLTIAVLLVVAILTFLFQLGDKKRH